MKVLIVGEPGEGKSTLARFLSKVLSDRGFEVVVIDDLEPSPDHITTEDLKRSVVSKICIETRNVARRR
jgi:adenylate kinase family enzyme